jgi:tripeptidyl-peptidase-1
MQAHDDFCTNMKGWTSSLVATDKPPLVHSLSYGWQANLDQLQCTSAQVADIEADFTKLAARGIAVMVASGDAGSGASDGPNTTLYPSWPASSPWVTAVGATRFSHGGDAGHATESASSLFGSGGGFSKMYNRTHATWQEADVANYLAVATALPPTTSFAVGGRATPDVSAIGEGYQVITGGNRTSTFGGTSASAPVFAAMVSLINEARLQNGLAQIGFLNPWIYQHKEAFTDIVEGTNAIDRDGESTSAGFNCTTGWDPVSGLGTPKFAKLLELALSTR